MRLSDADTVEFAGYQNKFIYHFILVADMIGVVSGSL